MVVVMRSPRKDDVSFYSALVDVFGDCAMLVPWAIDYGCEEGRFQVPRELCDNFKP
jgi:hypothetical protein